ncbi:hypothetical protein P8452_13294 [Trifolium repens]|nr:hypothetical protein P8452_13294 [Trifolium repens]
MAYNHVGGDIAHGLFFAILGMLVFIPGFYYTRIAYYAYKGYKGHQIRISQSPAYLAAKSQKADHLLI